MVLGFAIAATPGPIVFLCLRRTLTHGWRTGVISGLGVATADACYGALAAFSVAVVSAALVGQQRWLTLIGGLALVALGIRSLVRDRTMAAAAASTPPDPHPGSAYLVTLGLTLANPATILAFGAVFTVLGLRAGRGALQPALLVAGVLVGSATWWIVLASAVAALRARLTPAVVRGIGAASAAALLAFGVLAVSRAV